MTIIDNIAPEKITPDDFVALIEISKGSKMKYELDKDTGYMMLNRVLFTATRYPANYGLIPRTFAADGDHLDVLVLCSEPIDTNCLVRCYPIGMITMVDQDFSDEKIIAVPFGDPTYASYRTITELPQHLMEEIMHFFTVYKTLEGKKTAVESYCDEVEAKAKILECMHAFDELQKSQN